MLVRLCCHVERSDKIQMMLTAEELSEGAFDLARYDLLTKMAERESPHHRIADDEIEDHVARHL